MNKSTRYFVAQGTGIDHGAAMAVQQMYNEARAEANERGERRAELIANLGTQAARDLGLIQPTNEYAVSPVVVRTQHNAGGRGWRKRQAKARRKP